MTKKYDFYGWESAGVKDKHGLTPCDYYDILSEIWRADTCAPRMRGDWSPENKTLGQCSITAFLIQDIYGGKVYGVPLDDGNFHCFNDVNGCVFDLTSEQFGGVKLNYADCPEQFREVHFKKEEKKKRYELLKSRLFAAVEKRTAGESSGMKIYDISQEVFGCCVFPGDPAPERKELCSIEKGGVCNLTAFYMCAHNGTHVDAPFHFINGGKTVDAVCLNTFVGTAYVAGHSGEVTADNAAEILEKAKALNPESAKRILIKGPATVSAEAAKVFASNGILLLGNESQTVGPENAPMGVHLILLGAGVVLLEGIRLSDVPEGVYLLNAAPLNLSGADGSPCRAILIDV